MGTTPQTIDFPDLPGLDYLGADIDLVATASSGLPVTFTSLSPSTCSVVNNTKLHALGGGGCAVAANQPGNATYAAAPQESQSVVIDKATQVITFANPGTQQFGTSLTVTATASTGLPMSYFATGSSIACSVDQETGVVTFTDLGTCAIRAYQSGNFDYEENGALQTFQVVKGQIVLNAGTVTQVYGAPTPAPTPTVAGNANVLGPIQCFVNGSSQTPVGTYPNYVECAAQLFSNYYELTQVDGPFVVTKAPVVVTAGPSTSAYGSTPSAPIPSFDGFKNGDTSSALTTQPTCTVGVTATTTVGSYPSSTSCSGVAAANYSFSYVTGDAAVTRAPVVVTAGPSTSAYGSTPSAPTPSFDGFKNGDTSSALTTQPTCTAGVTATTTAGTYPNTTSCSGAAAANYSFTYVKGTATVSRIPVTVTASSGTMIYGSSQKPVITPTVSGANPNALGPITCVANVNSNTSAGTHYGAATCTAPNAQNYEVTFVPGDITVYKKTATISADSASIVYGQPDPALTYTVSGLKPGDALTKLPTCTVVGAHTNAGTYPITCSGAANSNYDIFSAPGTLTVTKAPVTVTANNQTKIAGSADPTFTSTTSGLLGGDTLSSAPTCAVAGAHDGAGTYPITCSGADAGSNYSISYASGTLTVTTVAKTITVTAPSLKYSFGATIPTTFTPSYAGYGAGQAPTTAPTCTSKAHTGSSAGTYPVTCAGGNPAVVGDLGHDYTFTYAAGSLTIGKAQCSDGIDNDHTGAKDYPRDPGCTSPTDNTERSPAACTSSTSITGTARGNTLLGTLRNDRISGGASNDALLGYGGNDCLRGGIGDDRLYGGYGNDFLNGGPGADSVYGGYGNDRISAADGNRDVVDCGPGTDIAVVDRKDVVKNCETKIFR